MGWTVAGVQTVLLPVRVSPTEDSRLLSTAGSHLKRIEFTEIGVDQAMACDCQFNYFNATTFWRQAARSFRVMTIMTNGSCKISVIHIPYDSLRFSADWSMNSVISSSTRYDQIRPDTTRDPVRAIRSWS